MTVRREGDRLIFEVTATEVAELDGAIRDTVIRHVASDIINNGLPKSLKDDVIKSVLTEITKQITDKFIEENGEEVIAEASEALEDLLENLT